MNTRVAVKRVKTELDIKKNTIKKAIDVQAKPVAVDNYPSPIYFKVDISNNLLVFSKLAIISWSLSL
jgi:hypothetical protein